MTKQTWMKIDGEWKKAKSAWIKEDGEWKNNVMPKGVVEGDWREFMSYFLANAQHVFTTSIPYSVSYFSSMYQTGSIVVNDGYIQSIRPYSGTSGYTYQATNMQTGEMNPGTGSDSGDTGHGLIKNSNGNILMIRQNGLSCLTLAKPAYGLHHSNYTLIWSATLGTYQRKGYKVRGDILISVSNSASYYQLRKINAITGHSYWGERLSTKSGMSGNGNDSIDFNVVDGTYYVASATQYAGKISLRKYTESGDTVFTTQTTKNVASQTNTSILYVPTTQKLWLNTSSDITMFDIDGTNEISFPTNAGVARQIEFVPEENTILVLTASAINKYTDTGELIFSQSITRFGHVFWCEYPDICIMEVAKRFSGMGSDDSNQYYVTRINQF